MEKTNGTILIVDDSSMTLELLEDTLAPLNCKILSYTSALKALDNLKDTSIDVVMIDIVMPELDGFLFIEKFMKTHKNTAVIFVSGHPDGKNKVRGYNLGSYTFIEKPFEVSAIRAQVNNILKLKKANDELLEEKEKLDCIFQYSSNEIILTDTDFNIINQNYKILTKTKNIAPNYIDILMNNKQNDAVHSLTNFAQSKEKQASFNVTIDNEKYIKTNVSKIYKNSRHAGFLIIMDDRTEEVKNEEQREQFIETLTHDLTTPVRAEQRALELLYDGSFGALQKEQKDIIKEILNSSRYMMRMTNNVLTKYRLDNNKFKIFKRTYSIKNSLEDCLEKLNYLFESENQTVKVKSNTTHDVFDFDEREIKRVLINLLANASEYSPTGSTIYVNITDENRMINLSVKDEGQGISKEMIKSLFDEEKFAKTRFKKVGSGMGLFIAKKIMEAHNGKIIIDSQVGKGTTFTLSLPIETESSEMQDTDSSANRV